MVIPMTAASGTSLATTVAAWMPPPARTLTQLTAVRLHTIATETRAPRPDTAASAGPEQER